MQTIVSQMLERCRADSLGEERNALKEVVQEVALCGLSRAGFFKSAAFYGGTALRIFYGLDRFSEDLDFSLIAPDPSFDLKAYFPILESEIRATGLNFTVEEKVKSAESNIRSAFLKGNTKEHILMLKSVILTEHNVGGVEKKCVRYMDLSMDRRYRQICLMNPCVVFPEKKV